MAAGGGMRLIKNFIEVMLQHSALHCVPEAEFSKLLEGGTGVNPAVMTLDIQVHVSPSDRVSQAHSACGPVTAGIVTYNRKDLLCRCIEACLSQTSPPDYVLILDNASTDGTKDLLRAKGYLADPRVSYYTVADNIGPAAAFDKVFRLAWQAGCGWLWIMDDDVIPSPTALQMLKEAFLENFASPEEIGFLASAIVSADGLPNNVPEIEMRRPPGEDPVWSKLLSQGLVRVRWATLDSTFIPRSTLNRIGSINPDLRWSDDIDFALRVAQELPIYLVGKSIATHLRRVTGTYCILTEVDSQRIHDFYYHYRNNVYFRRKYYPFVRVPLFIAKSITELFKCLFVKEHKFIRAKAVLLGLVSGIFFRPKPPEPIGRPLDVVRGEKAVQMTR
jgi:dTDP-4-dehydrorhamnose reductase